MFLANFNTQSLFFSFSAVSLMSSLKLSLFYVDSVGVLSTILYNSYFYYVIGCGLILLFIMLGVVLLLAESAFPFNEKIVRHNKYLIEYQQTVKNTRLFL